MKSPLFIISALGVIGAAGLGTSCLETRAKDAAPAAPAPENGAQFKKGEGLKLTEEMKQAIALKLADVGEEKIAPSFSVPLNIMGAGATGTEATGWIPPEQASLIKPGMEIELRPGTDGAATGAVVKRVEKVPYASLGDFEVTVEAAAPLPTGSRVSATFRAAAGEAVTAIPREALLKTAEGTFTYTVNGQFFMRTPVKVGAESSEFVQVTDGLYPGDQVVASPVMSLWMAELQVLRGGKACTCGH